jgi:hypothetical protein
MTAAAALAAWRARGGWVKVIDGGTEVAFMTPDGECRCDLLSILFAAEGEVLAVLLAEERELRRCELIALADALRGGSE